MRFVCLLCGQETTRYDCVLSFTNEGESLVLRNVCRSPNMRIAVGVLPTTGQPPEEEREHEVPNPA